MDFILITMLEYIIEKLMIAWLVWFLIIAPLIGFVFWYFVVPRFSDYPKNKKWIAKLIAILLPIWSIFIIWYVIAPDLGL